MAIIFPSSPTIGQTYTVGNTLYTWNGITWRASTITLIDSLGDVDTSTTPPTTNQVLLWDGTNWIPGNVSGIKYGTLAARPATPDNGTLYIVNGDTTTDNNQKAYYYLNSVWTELNYLQKDGGEMSGRLTLKQDIDSVLQVVDLGGDVVYEHDSLMGSIWYQLGGYVDPTASEITEINGGVVNLVSGSANATNPGHITLITPGIVSINDGTNNPPEPTDNKNLVSKKYSDNHLAGKDIDITTSPISVDSLIQYDGIKFKNIKEYLAHKDVILKYALGNISFPSEPVYAGTNRNVATQTDLNNAITASATGDTITLTADITITATITINKSIKIIGGGFSIQTAGGGTDPTTVINVTANNVTLDPTLTIKHRKTTNISIEVAVSVNATGFISRANVQFMEFGYILRGSFSIHGTTTYTGSLGNNHRHIAIYRISAPSQINGVIYDFPSEATPRASFIYLSSSNGTDRWDDLLYIANTNQLNPTRIQRQFFLMDVSLSTAGLKHKLWVHNNKWDDLNGGVGLIAATGVSILDRFEYIALHDNIQGSGAIPTSVYKGLLYIDGSGTLRNIGNTKFYYSNNIHPTTLRTTYTSAYDNGGIAYLTSMFNPFTVVLADEKAMYDSALAFSSGGGSVIQINDLSDVDTVTVPPILNDYLKFNGTNWVPGAGGGASSIDDLTDVDTSTTAPTVGQVLRWDGTNWIPATHPIITTGLFSARPSSNQINGQLYVVSGETVNANRFLNGRMYVYSSASTSWIEVAENARLAGPLTRFVAAWGNDTTGTGASTSPYATIAKAITDLTGGGTIYLYPGTYSGALTISTSQISLIGMLSDSIGPGAMNVIISGTVTISATQRVFAENIQFSAPTSADTPVLITSTTGGFRFTKCRFFANTNALNTVAVTGRITGNVWFVDCEFANSGIVELNVGTGIAATGFVYFERAINLRNLRIINQFGGIEVRDTVGLGITHGASALRLFNCQNITSFVSTCTNAGNGFLYVENSSTYSSYTNTYVVVNKSGNAPYTFKNFDIARTGNTITGTETVSPNNNRYIKLSELRDVDLITASPSTGQTLRWDGTNWVPSTPVSAINDLSDVDTVTAAPTNDQVLRWDGTNWVPVTLSIDYLSDVDTTTTPPTTGQILRFNGTNWIPVTNNIDGLTDVDTSTVAPTTSQLLRFDGTNWIPFTINVDYLSDADTATVAPVTGDLFRFNGTNWVPSTLLPSIDRLSDVDTSTTSPTSGQVLQWDGTNWVPGSVSGGGGGTLDGLSDVDTTGVAKDDILQYDGTNWVKKTDYTAFRSVQSLYNFTDASFPKSRVYAGTNRNVATEAELNTAITNSVAGDRITLTADINPTATININKSIRIIGNGFKIFVSNTQSDPNALLNITANDVTLDSTLIIEHLSISAFPKIAISVNAFNFVSNADLRFISFGYLLRGSFSIGGKTTNMLQTNTTHTHFIINKISAPSQINGVIYNSDLQTTTNSNFITMQPNAGLPSDGWYDLLYVANCAPINSNIFLNSFFAFLSNTFGTDTISNKKVLIVDNNIWKTNVNSIFLQAPANSALLSSFTGIAIINNTLTTTTTTNYRGLVTLDALGNLAPISVGSTNFIYFNNSHPKTNTIQTALYADCFDTGGVVYRTARFTLPTITPLTDKQIFENTLKYAPSVSLDYLSDVDTTGVTNGQILRFNGTNWVPATNNIDGLTDVDTSTTAPTNGQILRFNGTNWVPATNNIDGLTDVDTTTAAPTTGDLLRWNGTNWVPSTILPSIDRLSDVDTSTSTPTTGQVLRWDGTNWVPFTLSAGASTLSALSDVNTTGSTAGSILEYNGTTWSNVSKPLAFRNLIINGNFVVNQRRAISTNLVDFTVAATNTFLVDRFFLYQSANLANLRYMQGFGSYGLPPGFVGGNDYMTFPTYGSSFPTANDLQFLCYRIEGQTMRNLLWGTANAKPATLSFWVRTTESGFSDQKFGLTIKNGANSTITYATTYIVPTANTWHRISITIPGPTTGSWFSESLNCHIFWNFYTGNNFRAPAGSSNTWLTTGAENYYAASDSLNYSSSSGKNFSIYGVQFEEGSVATPFEVVPNEITMMRCQRYYYNFEAVDAEQYVGDGYVRNTTTQALLILRHPYPMMTAPNVRILGSLAAGDLAAFTTTATINSQANNKTNSRLIMTLASASTAYRPITFFLQSLLNNQLEVRAEV